jgi:hypothetical protein
MSRLVKISDLFNIIYGNGLELYKLELSNDNDTVNFVSRTSKNNGIIAKVKKLEDIEPFRPDVLTVAVGGSVLETFLQKQKFYTAYHILILEPKIKMNDKELLYYAYVISLNKYRYNYGRQANKSLHGLIIPQYESSDFDDIDLDNLCKIEMGSILKNELILNYQKWKKFRIEDYFLIKGTKTTPLLELEEYGKGKYPYVTTQATNNGIEDFYDYYTEDGNVITFDSAVIGYCAYQPLPFSASDHVEKLIPKFEMNKYVALFLVTVLNREQYRYNYGRKACQNRMRDIFVKLPAKNNQPDWKYIENFVKSLPYSSSL